MSLLVPRADSQAFNPCVALYEGVLCRMTARATWRALLPVAAACVPMIVAVEPAQCGIYDWICIVLVLPVLLLLGARWNAPAAVRSVFAWLGELSYPLYTAHYSLIFVATFVARRAGVPPIVWVPLPTTALPIVATLLARHVDRPARRWLDEPSRAVAQWRRRGQQLPAAAA